MVKCKLEDISAMSRTHIKIPIMIAHAWNPHVEETERGGFLDSPVR